MSFIKKNDDVIVIAGKNKGKITKVLQVHTSEQKVTLEDTASFKKHIKPGKNKQFPEGGIVELPRKVAISNVMLYQKSLKKGTRTHFVVVDGKKQRVSSRDGAIL